MAQFKITATISNPGAAHAAVFQGVLPRLTQAVETVAQQARIDWMASVKAAKLWSGEKVPYMGSIQWQRTGPFSAEVWSDYKYAKEIETGRPAKDLKKMLDTSLKVRTSKKGRRYMIIPFRHSTPGQDAIGSSMPEHVYAQAKKLSPSRITGQTQRLSGTGAMDIKTRQAITVNQNLYHWGQSLGAGSMGPNKKGKQDRFAGMYRFNTSSKNANSSTYLTFRVLMEGSPGWVIPAKPGLFLAQTVAQNLQPKAVRIFSEAVTRDFG